MGNRMDQAETAQKKTPEWIHEEDEMPMDLILQVQEEISKENRG